MAEAPLDLSFAEAIAYLVSLFKGGFWNQKEIFGY
jgi:hypothetical protein